MISPNASPYLRYPISLASGDNTTGEYRHYIQFKAKKYRAESDEGATDGVVTLYMPGEALKTSYGQTFGDADLGALGNLVDKMDAAGGVAVASAMKAGSMSRTKAALSSALGDDFSTRVSAALKESTAKSVKDKFSGGMFAGATTALQNVIGKVVNPHKAVIYSGPGGFRTFSYTFVMTPESEKEADEIKKIVYFFKYHMHPGVETIMPRAATGRGGSGGGVTPATQGSSTFTYPDEFTIALYPNGQTVAKPSDTTKPALFKINKCFLESLTTDYTTSGQPAFFKDSGNPVTTTLGLTFKETVLVTRNTISEGF